MLAPDKGAVWSIITKNQELVDWRLDTMWPFTLSRPIQDDKGDQPSGGETTWTNTGATRSGRGLHKTGKLGDGMLRPYPTTGHYGCPMMMVMIIRNN